MIHIRNEVIHDRTDVFISNRSTDESQEYGRFYVSDIGVVEYIDSLL
jgi:hypothetical protein